LRSPPPPRGGDMLLILNVSFFFFPVKDPRSFVSLDQKPQPIWRFVISFSEHPPQKLSDLLAPIAAVDNRFFSFKPESFLFPPHTMICIWFENHPDMCRLILDPLDEQSFSQGRRMSCGVPPSLHVSASVPRMA